MLKQAQVLGSNPQHQEKDVGNFPSLHFTNIPGPTVRWAGGMSGFSSRRNQVPHLLCGSEESVLLRSSVCFPSLPHRLHGLRATQLRVRVTECCISGRLPGLDAGDFPRCVLAVCQTTSHSAAATLTVSVIG